MFHLQGQLFSKVNIPDSGILTINPSLPVNECAEDYARKLKEVQHLFLFFGSRVTWTCSSAILWIIDCKFQTHRPSQMTISPCSTCYCLEWDLTGIHVPSSQNILFWRWELYIYQTYKQRNDFLLSLLPFSPPFMPFKRKDERRKMQLWLFQSSCYIKDVIFW